MSRLRDFLAEQARRYQTSPYEARKTDLPDEVALWGPPDADGLSPAVLLRRDGDIEIFTPKGLGVRLDEEYQSVVWVGKRLKLFFDEIYLYAQPGKLYLNDEPIEPTRPYTLVVPPSGGVFRIPGNTQFELPQASQSLTRLQTAQRAVMALARLLRKAAPGGVPSPQ